MLVRCSCRKVENENTFSERVYKIWKENKDRRIVSFSLTTCDKLEDDLLQNAIKTTKHNKKIMLAFDSSILFNTCTAHIN